MSPPYDWQAPDWRVSCHSIEGIANSSPMDYKKVIQDLEESDLSKDKEMLQIFEDIKLKSTFFWRE